MEKQHQKVDAERAHMKQFIDKFRCNANRAALVQSRIKALNRLPNLEEILDDPSLCFQFSEPEELPHPMLQIDCADFKYESDDGIK